MVAGWFEARMKLLEAILEKEEEIMSSSKAALLERMSQLRLELPKPKADLHSVRMALFEHSNPSSSTRIFGFVEEGDLAAGVTRQNFENYLRISKDFNGRGRCTGVNLTLTSPYVVNSEHEECYIQEYFGRYDTLREAYTVAMDVLFSRDHLNAIASAFFAKWGCNAECFSLSRGRVRTEEGSTLADVIRIRDLHSTRKTSLRRPPSSDDPPTQSKKTKLNSSKSSMGDGAAAPASLTSSLCQGEDGKTGKVSKSSKAAKSSAPILSSEDDFFKTRKASVRRPRASSKRSCAETALPADASAGAPDLSSGAGDSIPGGSEAKAGEPPRPRDEAEESRSVSSESTGLNAAETVARQVASLHIQIEQKQRELAELDAAIHRVRVPDLSTSALDRDPAGTS